MSYTTQTWGWLAQKRLWPSVRNPLSAFRILRQIGGQELDRGLPIEPDVFREKHFPHPTGAKPCGDAIVANRGADHAKCVLSFSR